MARKSIRQDLILKGLDPNNVVVGIDGLFSAKSEPSANTTEEKSSKNAFVLLDDSPPQEETNTEEIQEPKMPKAKKKTKSE